MLTVALRTIRSISDEHAERCSEVRRGPDWGTDRIRSFDRYAEGQLVDFGFSARYNFTAFFISFGGVRASSTSGIAGAMTNWIKAAERRIGA